jgi:hypothetical protein
MDPNNSEHLGRFLEFIGVESRRTVTSHQTSPQETAATPDLYMVVCPHCGNPVYVVNPYINKVPVEVIPVREACLIATSVPTACRQCNNRVHVKFRYS